MLLAGRSPFRVPDEVDFFNLPNPSSHTMVFGSTQPLTEMSTRNLPRGKRRPVRRADNLAAICENVGTSTSRNPKGLHGLYRDSFTLPLVGLTFLTFIGRFSIRISARASAILAKVFRGFPQPL
jgi:hypothetical protein